MDMKWIAMLLIGIILLAGCTASPANPGTPANTVPTTGLAGLEASGMPIACNVSASGINEMIQLKGPNVRVQIPIEVQNKSYMITSLIVNDTLYLATANSTFSMAGTWGCDWIVQNDTRIGGATQGMLIVQGLSRLPPAELSCSPGAFGDELFALSGRVCTVAEYSARMSKGLQACANTTNASARKSMGCRS